MSEATQEPVWARIGFAVSALCLFGCFTAFLMTANFNFIWFGLIPCIAMHVFADFGGAE